jgi:succinate dehydrogenase / fumarate reductase cytochrome b subunit
MLAWAMHRLTGVGVLLFLFMHIYETSLILQDPSVYNHALELYRQWWFKPVEFALVAAVIYHAGNGVLVMLVDLMPNATRWHKKAVSYGAVIFGLVMIPVAWLVMISPMLGKLTK